MKSKEKACDSQISDEIIQCPKYNFHFLGSKESAYHCTRRGFNAGVRRSPGKGNGNLLQYSCLENPRDRVAWWAAVHGVAKSWTCLRDGARTHTHTHSIRKRKLDGNSINRQIMEETVYYRENSEEQKMKKKGKEGVTRMI